MSLKQTLKNIIISGLFIIPTVPLVVTDSLFFPFITGKALVFRTIIEIIFLAWIALVLLDKEYLPKISWISTAIGIFIVVVSIADIFGISPYFSFWSNFERMEGLITLLHLGAFFVVLGSVFDQTLWKRFFHTSIFVSVIISIYSFSQIAGYIEILQGGARVDGTMGNAIYLALYLMFNFFICLFYFFQSQKYKIAYIIVMLMQILVIYFTASRGVILGLFGGLLLMSVLIFLLEKERKVLRRNIGFTLLGLLILIASFWVLKDSNFVNHSQTLERFSELSFESIKEQGRFIIWPMAIEGFKDKPILGYGQENFNYVFSKNYDPRAYNQEPWFDRVHNTFLDWLIVGGTFGLLAYLFLLFSLFFALWKSSLDNISKSVLTGLLGAYIFQSIFIFDNLTSYIMFFSVISFLWYKESSTKKINLPWNNIQLKVIKYVVLPLCLVLFIISSYFFNFKPLLASRSLILAIHPQSTLENGLEEFRNVFNYNSLGSREALFQLLTKTQQILNADVVPQTLKDEYLIFTEEKIDQVLSRFSFDTRSLLIVGSFYAGIGNIHGFQNKPVEANKFYDKGLAYLEKAREISPKRQDILMEIGTVDYIRGDLKNSLNTFKSAFELEPRNIESRIRYAVILIVSGEVEKADLILGEVGEEVYFDPRIINSLAEKGQYQKLKNIWKSIVLKNPLNAEYRKSLVAAYIILDELNSAIEELQNVVEIDPSFKESAEYAINEIKAGRGRQLLEE